MQSRNETLYDNLRDGNWQSKDTAKSKAVYKGRLMEIDETVV